MLMSNTVSCSGSDRLNNAQSNEPRETQKQQKQGKEKDKEFEGKILCDSPFHRFQAFKQKQEEVSSVHRERCYRTKVFKAVGRQWKRDHSCVYVPFLPLSFMSTEKACTVSKMQHFKM